MMAFSQNFNLDNMRIICIVVTYNPDKELLQKQYLSMCNQVDMVVYIDNGSYMKLDISNKGKVLLVCNKSNQGLGIAQNQGIKIAIQNGADFVLLLDQDSILPDNMVPTLIREYNKLSELNEKVAAICPAIFSDFTKTVCDVPVSLGLQVRTTKPEGLTNVVYAISSGSLIPVDIIKKVGGIQEDFFIDSMDAEWCMRASSMGYNTYVTSETQLTHQLGNGAKVKVLQHSPIREYYIIRNSIALVKLPYVPMGFKLRRIILSIGRVFYSLIHGYWTYFLEGFKGLFAGMFVNTKKYIYGS